MIKWRVSKQADIIKNHKFDSWTQQLMQKAPTLDQWQIDQIKADRLHGPYRQKYQSLPIKDNNEPLVPCSIHGLVSKDYYFNKLADGKLEFLSALRQNLFYPVAWLRKTVVLSLAKVDEVLRQHGLFLVVVSGWRHPQVQELAIQWAKETLGSEETIRRFANTDPSQPKYLVPHQTGGACDLEIWSKQLSQPLTRMDHIYDEVNFFKLEQKEGLSEEEMLKRQVRRLMYHVLCTPSVCLPKDKVFTIHPGEFWHFGFGDPLTAFFRRDKYAIFGDIRPPPEADMYWY